MVHGLAIRRGGLSLLCNGRPVVNKYGDHANDYKGSTFDLVKAVTGTQNSQKRMLIPQANLEHEVTCKKCLPLMDEKTKQKHMRKIYKNSVKWKTRNNSKPHKIHRMEAFGSTNTNKTTKTASIPFGEFTISVSVSR